MGGYENRPGPVQLGVEKTTSRASDSGTRSVPGETPANPVHITDQARRLATLEQAVQAAPIVNETRVAEIRDAIEAGRYEIAPQRIADKLLRLEQELKIAEH
ncbi:negative regulator of flagellin synthesis FlgM [Steroidobacter denitrificans]|uniref:Negative regulator of flagellin synthesis n=1 Tax=Steroidobacter denitrificans TaxID=465721 RepID=A0A127F809_STEDE|nr:negative regulator of flagellin synthesis FlgM [Steroidobacter denitrificans]